MAEFRKCFQSIDTENTGTITVEDLRAYMQKKNYKEKFVARWISLFDPNNEGVITYENYCRTLGLIPRRHEGEQSETKAPTESAATSQPSSSPSSTENQTESKQPQSKAKSRTPTPPAPSAEDKTAITQIDYKDRKSKPSESEKSGDTPPSPSEAPSIIEEPIVPAEKPVSFARPSLPSTTPATPPSSPASLSSFPSSVDHKQAETTPVPKTKSDDHKSKRRRNRKSTSSQSEHMEEPVKPKSETQDTEITQTEKPMQVEDAVKSSLEQPEPMDVEEQQPIQPTEQANFSNQENDWIETKQKKGKIRKHKISPTAENLQTTQDHQTIPVKSHVDEVLITPEQSIHMNVIHPSTPEEHLEKDQNKAYEPQETSKSQPDSHHGSPVHESQIISDTHPHEEMMEVEHQVMTHAMPTDMSFEVPVDSTPTGDEEATTTAVVMEEKSKKVKARKSKRSQSENVEESIQPITVDSSSKPCEFESFTGETTTSVHESKQLEHNHSAKQKKTRAKKTPSHSESEDHSKALPVQVADEPILLEKQSSIHADTVTLDHMVIEPEQQQQSTTPLHSAKPISPSEEFICVSDTHHEQPSAFTHDVAHEMEVKHLGAAVHEAPTLEEPAVIAEPMKTETHKEEVGSHDVGVKVDASKQIVTENSRFSKTIPETGKHKEQEKENATKTSPPVEPKKQTKKQDKQEKQNLTEKQPTKSQPQLKTKVTPVEIDKPKKSKDKFQTPSKETDKIVKTETLVKKKADKQKIKDSPKLNKKRKATENSEFEQPSKRSKNPAFEPLTRLKRIGPISARRLKDKKPIREKKSKEADKETKEEPEKVKKHRFSRSFIVQPGPDSYARASKEVQRKHERLLKRKVERLEKVKRKKAKTIRPKYRWKVRPSLRNRGVVVILLAGIHRGKRVISLGRQRSTGLLLVTGPFRYNGCPLRRVHPNMVIATKTSVDLSKFRLPLRIHRKEYFARKRNNKRQKLDDSLLLKPEQDQDATAYKPDEQRKADQLLVDEAVCKAIKAHTESRMLVKYLKSLFSIGKHDKPHLMNF